MNEQASKAADGYYTPDAFSGPGAVLGSWVESMKRVVGDPLGSAFPTITNDPDGTRTYGKGKTEYNARTLQYDKYYNEPINSGENLFNLFGSKYDPTTEPRGQSARFGGKGASKASATSAPAPSGESPFDKLKGLFNKD